MKCLNDKIKRVWEKAKVGGKAKNWLVWPPKKINRKRFFIIIRAEITFTDGISIIEYYYKLYKLNKNGKPYDNKEHFWNPYLLYKEIPEIKGMKIEIKDCNGYSSNLYNPYTGHLNG